MNYFLKLSVIVFLLFASCTAGSNTQATDNQQSNTSTNQEIETLIETEIITEEIDSLNAEIDAMLKDLEH